jgi:ubiquinone/menaquinone biosynthesis C-methylase UbiE
MSFTDLFSERSDLYARARPHYPLGLFTFIATHAPSLERVWDCGTGNGQAAISLAAHFSEVYATDPSRDQINHATPASNVCYSVQPAEQTAFPAKHFDAICVAQALHWFDFETFFSEVKRLAKPGAIFAAWGYSWPCVTASFDNTFKSVIRDVIEPYWAPQNRLLWNAYSDVPFPFDRLDTPEFQISVSWTFHQFISYIATWSATRKCAAETGVELMDNAEPVLRPLWGNPDVARDVCMPLCVLAGHVS